MNRYIHTGQRFRWLVKARIDYRVFLFDTS